MLWEYTGAAGLDPRPYQLCELREIAKHKWDQTALITATIQGLFDSKASLESCNPYRQAQTSSGEDVEVKIQAIKGQLPPWRPPE